jgi:hypothetical protein
MTGKFKSRKFRDLNGGWTICEIVLYAQRRALGRLDKLSYWGAKLVAQQQGFEAGEMAIDQIALQNS